MAQTVRMVRPPDHAPPHTADVHPAEVENYRLGGWEPADQPMAAREPDAASVTIPDDWRALSWTRPNEEGLSLRALASQVTTEAVVTKDDAIAAIEAELARRAAETA